jgi:hypothetical protein
MATIQVTVFLKGVEVDLDVDFTPGWSTPAKLSGHPDNWEPSDGENAQIEEATLHLRSGRYVSVLKRLDPVEIEKIQESCDEYRHDPRDDYNEPDDDYDPRDSYNVDCGTDNWGRSRN